MIPYNIFKEMHFSSDLTYQHIKTYHYYNWDWSIIIDRFSKEFDEEFIELIAHRLDDYEKCQLTECLSNEILFGPKFMFRKWHHWLDPNVITERLRYFYPIQYTSVPFPSFIKESEEAPSWESDKTFDLN